MRGGAWLLFIKQKACIVQCSVHSACQVTSAVIVISLIDGLKGRTPTFASRILFPYPSFALQFGRHALKFWLWRCHELRLCPMRETGLGC